MIHAINLSGAYLGGKVVINIDKSGFGHSNFELYELVIKHTEYRIRELPVYRWYWDLWIGCVSMGVGFNV